MRYALSCLVVGLCVLIACPASASGLSTGADVSAAKKKKQRPVVQREVAPSVAARRGWFDPSLGPDGKPYRNPYPPGTCSVDMGYGRFSTCDFHE